jgi:hypothetical protein
MMKRIHIVGSGPRTGTTLLMEMMINGFEIDLYPQHEARLGKPPPGSGKIFLSKSPKDIVIVRKHLKVMRNLYVIYVMRDPRDSAVSKHGVNKEKYYGDLRYWKRFLPFYEKIRHHPRFIQVKYEDMVRNPDEVQATIEQHIPFLKYKDSFSNFHLHARPSKNTSLALRGLRKVDAGGIGNWKNHKARLLGQITLHGSITEDLIRYGYEQDESWLEQLEGEEPDLTESHAMPFYEQKFIRSKQYFRYVKALKVWFYHTDLYLGIRRRFHRD